MNKSTPRKPSAPAPTVPKVGASCHLANIKGRDIPARLVFCGETEFLEWLGEHAIYSEKLVTVDESGGYWFVHWKRAVRDGATTNSAAQSAVMQISGTGALAILAEQIEDEHLRGQMLRAIDSPGFAFMPEVPTRPKAKRLRKAKAAPAPCAAPVVWHWHPPAETPRVGDMDPAKLAGIMRGEAAPADEAELTSALTVAARVGCDSMGNSRFVVHPYKCRRYPKVKWVVNGYVRGQRARKFFQSEGEARTSAHLQNTELRNKGREAMDFPSWLRTMAQRCHELLQPTGATIEEAVRYYLAGKARESQSITLKACIENLVQTRQSEAVTARYVVMLRTTLQRFAETIGPQIRVAEISTREIDAYLGALRSIKDPTKAASAWTRLQTRRMLATLFGYAKKHRYCVENPVESAMRVKLAETEVGIFRPEEISALLTHAPVEWVPFLALGAFAGLRVAELLRLDWRDVKLDRSCVWVPAAKAKSARRRIVKIQPCLDAWIRPLAKVEGKIVAVNHFVPHEMLRAAIAAAKLPVWVRNGLRHSFASYHIAKWKDAAALALEMGHTTTKLIFSHYRALVHEDDAERYWKIFPASSAESANVVNFGGSPPSRRPAK